MSAGESPVERLAELLMMEFEKGELEPELKNYEGDFPTKVLEYCLNNDPAEIIKKMFGKPHLLNVLKSYNVAIGNINDDIDLLATYLLKSLGFPVIPKIVGIKKAINSAERCLQNIKMVSEKERVGWMTDLYNELERILRDVFVFYSCFLFKIESNIIALNAFLKEKFGCEKPIDKLGLGDFVSHLRDLDANLSADAELKKRLEDTFKRPTILPKTYFKMLDDVSKYRKFFVHPKGRTPSVQECQNIAANILTLLNSLEVEMIYPDIIRINEIVVNRYGVKYVKAEDESGNLWKIYTNISLDISKLYFVYSKTGQLAINPVLIEKINI
jgi:hypothetical protein